MISEKGRFLNAASIVFLAISFFVVGCQKKDAAVSAESTKSAGPGGWLKGDIDQKFNTVARQMRGFDVTMMETGYRYIELYWAGKEGNWGFAQYQAEKIRTAIQDGLERRPMRANSAGTFMRTDLPNMFKAVSKKDSALFMISFQALTASCNACHAMEKVEFVRVSPPQWRNSPVTTNSLSE